MSRPPSFVPPACARGALLDTTRGSFAVLDARPEGEQTRGTALLLPGYTGSKEDFMALLEPATEAGYRCIAVDGRGQYETPGPDDPAAYAQQELARDVLAQAEAVGGPVHLLGHSLGGQIARAAVLLDARPFRSLTLMSSGPARISPSQRSRVDLLSGALQTMSMREVWDAIQALEKPPLDETDTDHDTPDLQARWLRNSPAQLIATGAQLAGEPDRVDDLARVPLPKHVLSGERDETWPVPLIDEMAVRLRAHRTVIAGAEHSPNTDRPGTTAAALVEFWDGVERTG
ncbi:short chain dehydrogenase [Streptomyces sp. YIM 130001]|uniref:alpha/beta fold hydrolase n=1 Tax=Streptomyces sp. YIM 130001 TaxID=2259644 RepID=UPI000E64EAA2|nr:alpha/beta hydrolase [Streptomyces sp. YIM 130001]RII16153.1 short chain dehydrogenase [Streptomyces sp. YIM 130001]